jgi:hypothetical protein
LKNGRRGKVALDYSSLLYGPNFRIHGVTGVLTVEGGDPKTLPVIDKTHEEPAEEVAPGVQRTRPLAAVMCADLEGAVPPITLEQLDGAALAFNGKSYRITSHLPETAPDGEAQVFLYLEVTA